MISIIDRRCIELFRRPAMSLRWVAWTLIMMIASHVVATDLTGVVVAPQDAGVANVGVKLSSVQFGIPEPIVLAETSTDDEGAFRVTIPESWYERPPQFLGTLVLTARSGDQLYGGVQVVIGSPLSHHPLQIRLQPWSKRTISITSENDKPVVGVKVSLTGLQLPVLYPPRYSQIPSRQLTKIVDPELRSSGVTDEAGKVELRLPPPEQTGSIDAEVEAGVVVTWSVDRSYPADSNQYVESEQWTDKLVVPPLRRIPVEASFNETDNARISVVSRPAMSTATTVIVTHQLDLAPDRKTSVVLREDAIALLSDKTPTRDDIRVTPSFFQVSSDLEKMALSVGKGVLTTGRVVSSDGQAAAEIRLVAINNRTWTVVSTDRDGRFEITAAPGALMLVAAGRSGYRAPAPDPKSMIVLPQEAVTHDVGDVVFEKLRALNGVVQDTRGEPVESALVTAVWEEPDQTTQNRSTIRREEQVRTDADGKFLFPDVDPQATPRIGAQHRDRVSQGLRTISSDELDRPVTIQLSSEAAICVAGRVLDQAGNGLPSLPVTLRHRVNSPMSDAQLANGTSLQDYSIETDGSGHFETPKSLPAWGEYIALIRVGTKQEAISGWKTVQSGKTLGKTLVLPPIEASTLSTISGRVVTLTGSPVSKARVAAFSGTGQSETVSADDGSFSLEVPPGRTPMIIAEAEGYLSNGSLVKDAMTSLEVAIPREGQPLPKINEDRRSDEAPFETWTADQRRDLAIKLASGAVDADEYTTMSLDTAIARYVPNNVLPKLDQLPAAKSQAGQMIRSALAFGLAPDQLDESLRVIDQLPGDRKQIMLLQFERSVTMPHNDRLRMLARIVQQARGMTQAELRVMTFGLAGERLIDLGQRESGEALIREAAEDAEKLAPVAFSGYARGAFAEELSQVDAEAALKLIQPLTDASSYNRHLQNIAHELAAIQPDLAVKLLDELRETEDTQRLIINPREAAIMRVCYRMIRVQPDKATTLARTIKHSSIRPYCFVVMIDSLLSQDQVSGSDRQRAGELHREAWQMLQRIRQDEDLTKVAYLFPSTIAGLLLEQTAKIDRLQLPYRVWQTIALRRPFEASGSYQFAGFACTCEMALAIADVDPQRARQVASWLPRPTGGANQFAAYFQASRGAAQLIAELFPDQCEAALDAITETSINNRMRLGVVQTLLRTDIARSRSKRSHFALWFPDDEDHVPVD